MIPWRRNRGSSLRMTSQPDSNSLLSNGHSERALPRHDGEAETALDRTLLNMLLGGGLGTVLVHGTWIDPLPDCVLLDLNLCINYVKV